MTIGFQPSDDNVLLRLRTAPHAADDGMADWGDVLAIGPGRRTADGGFAPLDLDIGDHVALRPGRAVHLRIQEENLAIAGASDVLGVLLPATGKKRRRQPAKAGGEAVAERAESAASGDVLETDVAPDLLDREASTADDLH